MVADEVPCFLIGMVHTRACMHTLPAGVVVAITLRWQLQHFSSVACYQSVSRAWSLTCSARLECWGLHTS